MHLLLIYAVNGVVAIHALHQVIACLLWYYGDPIKVNSYSTCLIGLHMYIIHYRIAQGVE